jgi:ribosome-associated translation inhibitor RaiA
MSSNTGEPAQGLTSVTVTLVANNGVIITHARSANVIAAFSELDAALDWLKTQVWRPSP